MRIKKKDIPISIHKILEPFIAKIGSTIIIQKEPDSLINIIDKDQDSDFYFKIISYSYSTYSIEKKPTSKHNNGVSKNLIVDDSIVDALSEWISIIEIYETTPTYLDDPILKSFEEEFYADFEILDEDKDKPLENEKILLLDEYLENLVKGLEVHKTEENKNKIQEIQENIILLQENLTNNTRQEIAEKVSKIFAKIKKLGTKYLKEFITEGTKQLISKGVKFLIEHGPNIIEEIGKNI